MAFDANELFSSNTVAADLRFAATVIQPKTFAAGSGTIGKGSPVIFNASTGQWSVWTAKTSEVTTLTANATPATAGDFTLTVEGETTTAIAYNANAAAVKAALEALGGINVGDVAVVDAGGGLATGDGTCTITFQGGLAGQALTVSANFTNLTGNAHTLTETTAGADYSEIEGFAWPDDVTLVAGKEVIGNVMLGGIVHRNDVVVPAGESQGNLDAALKADSLREKGITVQGLAAVA